MIEAEIPWSMHNNIHDFLITEAGTFVGINQEPVNRDFSDFNDSHGNPYSENEPVHDSVIREFTMDGSVELVWRSWTHRNTLAHDAGRRPVLHHPGAEEPARGVPRPQHLTLLPVQAPRHDRLRHGRPLRCPRMGPVRRRHRPDRRLRRALPRQRAATHSPRPSNPGRCRLRGPRDAIASHPMLLRRVLAALGIACTADPLSEKPLRVTQRASFRPRRDQQCGNNRRD